MPKKVYVKAKFENATAQIARSGGKWVVRRKGTINGHLSTQTTVCNNLFAAIKERFTNR